MICSLSLTQTIKVKSYQISPNGTKILFNNTMHELELSKEEAEKLGENPAIKTTNYFITVYFGENDERMAFMHKTIFDMKTGALERTFTIHKYKGSVKQLMTCTTSFADDNITKEKEMKTLLASYDQKVSLPVHIQEVIYESGHRIIDQIKLVTKMGTPIMTLI